MNKSDLKLVNTHRRTQAILGWLNLALLAGAAVSVALLIAVNSRRAGSVPAGLQVSLILSSVILGILALALPVGYFIARGEANRVQQLIDGFGQGHYLVRWTYTSELWKRFREIEQRESAGSFRQALWGLGIGWAITAAIFILISLGSRGSASGREHISGSVLTWILSGITVFFAGILIACWVTYRSKIHFSSAAPQDSIVSKRGIFVDGQFILWGTANRKLEKIEVIQKEGLGMLEVSIGISNNTIKSHVLIPPGSEHLAKKVAKVIMEDPTASQGGGAAILQDIAQTLSVLR